MRTYVITTGVVFGLLTAAHVWRMLVEGQLIAREPWYLLITAVAAGLSLWAWRLVRRSPRT